MTDTDPTNDESELAPLRFDDDGVAIVDATPRPERGPRFRIDGDDEVFETVPVLPAKARHIVAGLLNAESERRIEILGQFYDMVLTDESRERFIARWSDRSRPITGPELWSTFNTVIRLHSDVEDGARPTNASSSSAPGGNGDATSSGAGASPTESTPTPSPSPTG